jgi:hypothetical protein
MNYHPVRRQPLTSATATFWLTQWRPRVTFGCSRCACPPHLAWTTSLGTYHLGALHLFWQDLPAALSQSAVALELAQGMVFPRFIDHACLTRGGGSGLSGPNRRRARALAPRRATSSRCWRLALIIVDFPARGHGAPRALQALGCVSKIARVALGTDAAKPARAVRQGRRVRQPALIMWVLVDVRRRLSAGSGWRAQVPAVGVATWGRPACGYGVDGADAEFGAQRWGRHGRAGGRSRSWAAGKLAIA